MLCFGAMHVYHWFSQIKLSLSLNIIGPLLVNILSLYSSAVGHFEKWLPQPSGAELEMAQYPNMFIIL